MNADWQNSLAARVARREYRWRSLRVAARRAAARAGGGVPAISALELTDRGGAIAATDTGRKPAPTQVIFNHERHEMGTGKY